MPTLRLALLALLYLASMLGLAQAQLGGFFDQMFGGQQQQHPHQHPHQHQQQNAPSSPQKYQEDYNSKYCDNYLCPDTQACVHFPHHCPCPWEAHQDKVETGEGHRFCASKGGQREGEVMAKIELARQGLL